MAIACVRCNNRDAVALAASVLLAAGILAACETVPYTGRSQLQLISPQQESQMGAQAFQDIVGKAKLSNDGATSEMVTRVGKRIAAVSGHPEYQWEYRLIQDDKQANAFALPGGKVAVYTGILPITRDEAASLREITREQFEKLIQPIIDRTVGPCKQALKDAGLEAKDIDEVVLVGGQTRMPRIQALVKELCEHFEAGKALDSRSPPMTGLSCSPTRPIPRRRRSAVRSG